VPAAASLSSPAQPQPPGGSLEERHPEVALELAQLTRERRLGHVDPVGGTDGAGVGRGHEVGEVTELHHAFKA
jgi:hypothetical protein